MDLRDYQGTAVMNYADAEIPYTRIHEFKHLHPERSCYGTDRTIICREFPVPYRAGLERYYPINDAKNSALFKRYAADAGHVPHYVFGGRLGAYQYWDMDQAIANALEVFAHRLRRG